jgi:hypothetical protein
VCKVGEWGGCVVLYWLCACVVIVCVGVRGVGVCLSESGGCLCVSFACVIVVCVLCVYLCVSYVCVFVSCVLCVCLAAAVSMSDHTPPCVFTEEIVLEDGNVCVCVGDANAFPPRVCVVCVRTTADVCVWPTVSLA